MPPTNSVPQLLTIEQLAERFSTSPRHIRRLISQRRIPFLKIGRLVRFDAGEIANWVDSLRQATAPPVRRAVTVQQPPVLSEDADARDANCAAPATRRAARP